jgi:pimeloyl-ACP methyl ester carboxylesterase
MQTKTYKTIFLLLFLHILPGYIFSQAEKRTGGSNTIVLIHGMYQNSYSWIKWKDHFEKEGYKVYTPSYPYHIGHPKALNDSIDPRLADLTFKPVLDYISAFIDSLPEKPIVIGHSIGGLIMQKLVEAGKAEMGIALASANPPGISVVNWRYLRSNFRMVSPFRRRDIVCRPAEEYRWLNYTFFNTLNDSMAKVEIDRFFVPESRKLAKSTAKECAPIDFSKPHVPMLFISGEKDNDLPPPLIYRNYKAYSHKESVTSYYQFPGKSHYIASEPGFEDVINYVSNWIKLMQKTPTQ